jgi:acetyl esterase/lipase
LAPIGVVALAACIPAAPCRAGKYDVTYGETYAQRDSGPLKADVYVPQGEGPFPGVIVIHGGAWRMGTRAQLAGVAQQLAAHGLTAVAISYRLAPQYKFPAQIDDCKEAVRWMRTNAANWKIDPEHIGGFGYSAGAQLVALLGTTDAKDGLEGVPDPAKFPTTRLQAVAAGGAPCDFRPIPPNVAGLAFWLGDTQAHVPEQYRLASPAAFVTPDDPPMFFFHGESDDLVPRLSPERMVAALTAVGVPTELYIVPGCGHIMACMNWAAIDKSVAFLAAHLTADTSKPEPRP